MSYFTTEEAAYLAATTVRLATLVEFRFTGQTTFLWNGFGQRDFAGQTYIGCGDMGTIEGLEEARGVQSQQVTFTLSGVSDSPADLLSVVLNASDLVQGNIAVVSLQLFDAAWVAVGNPIPVYFGIMMPPRVAREAATETDGARRTLVLPTENIFFSRHRPPSGRYTDQEQKLRQPGDRFCEYTPQLANLVINWPDF